MNIETTIHGERVVLTKDEIARFAYLEYDSLTKPELIELLVELDMNSAGMEESYKELFEHYDDEERAAILAKIRK